jgi:hypothetical protein
MDLDNSIGNESPRRRIARRFGASRDGSSTLLVLGACRGDRWGYIGDPRGGPVSVYQGDAEFGFGLLLRDGHDEEEAQAVVTGEITYHDSSSSITLEGDLQPTLFPEIPMHGHGEAADRAECSVM